MHLLAKALACLAMISPAIATFTTKATLSANLSTRNVADVVKVARTFSSDIKVTDPDRKTANAKSLFKLQTLQLVAGPIVEITGEGDDERQAVETLARMVGEFE